jgi:signal peptidase II
MVERSLSAGPFHWLALLAVAGAGIVADQITKGIVISQLDLGESVHLVGPLSIRHVNNPGIAFGLFSSWATAVTILTACAIAWMVVYFARSGARHPVLPVALGLLIGGSLANLVDRVRLGHVTDFLDLRFWPAFNLADTFIVVGVGILLAALVSAERQPRVRRTAPKTSG